MSLHTRVLYLKTVPAGSPLGYGGTFVTRRESRIATLPIGYEDGLSRAVSNRGRVIVRGELAPIVGRISMDLTLVDATDVREVTIGDEVVIIGSQGERQITAEEVAAFAGTISYEVTCGVSDRVPRRIVVSGQ
jgi:alanine racemase